MNTRSVEIVIDEVVLRGVRPEDRYEIADALHETLSELATSALASRHEWSPREEASRRSPPVHLSDPSATSIGESVARSMFEAIGGVRP